jgi:hypothetical protein
VILWGGYCEGVFVEKTHNGWLIGQKLYMGYTKREAVRKHKKEQQ